MDKWSALTISMNYDSGGLVVLSTDNVDLQWLHQHFPKVTLTEDKAFSDSCCWRCFIDKLAPSESTAAFWAIVKYLGQTGWEPLNFSGDGRPDYSYAFRRCSTQS